MYTVKACVGSGGIIPLILWLRRVFSSTTRLLYHLGRSPGARTGLDALKMRIMFAPPPGFEPLCLGCTASSVVTDRSICQYVYTIKDLLLTAGLLVRKVRVSFCSQSCSDRLWYPTVFLCNGHSVLVFGGEAGHILPCCVEI